jgi:2'-5' RNA ligase
LNASGEKKIRAFIALKPPVEWEQEFSDLQANLKRELPGKSIKWVDPRQIHITLRFLGSIVPADAAAVSLRITEICQNARPLNLIASGLGCFPVIRKPRVLWAGLRGDETAVEELYRRINEATREIGAKPDDRKFNAHLTLARLKEPSRNEIDILQTALDRPFKIEAPWRVREVLLMRSHLLPGGPRYEMLSAHPLAE